MIFEAQSRKHTCGLGVLWCLLLLTPASIEAQRRGVTLTGAVEETVALSIAPNSIHSDIDLDVVSSGSTVRIAASGTGNQSPVIRMGLLVRSNVGFNISGRLESEMALVTQLAVIDVRDIGKLVSPDAIDSLQIPREFDMRGRKDAESSEKVISILDVSQPFRVLSGPRVSIGGTLESPNNALQVTVLIRIKPQSNGDWRVQLTFFSNKQAVEKLTEERGR